MATTPVAPPPFDLHATVTDMVHDGQSTDAIVDAILERLDPSEMHAALRVLLPGYVQSLHRLERPRPEPVARAPKAQPPSRWERLNPAQVEQLRRRILQEAVDTPTGRKQLGQCTADDIGYLADKRFRQATALDRIRRAMLQLGVATVAELGDEPVRLMVDA